jgi:hypothetical protein
MATGVVLFGESFHPPPHEIPVEAAVVAKRHLLDLTRVAIEGDGNAGKHGCESDIGYSRTLLPRINDISITTHLNILRCKD